MLALIATAWAGDPTLSKACKGGDLEACVDLGLLLEEELPGSPVALKRYEQACEGGSARGCGERGAAEYRAGRNAEAVAWASRGCVAATFDACSADPLCRSGTARACRAVYAAAEEDQRFEVAIEAGTLACRAGDAQMCQVAYSTPRITDPGRLAILRIGCEQLSDARMCNELGAQLTLGDLGERDEVAGLKWIERACELGSVQACLSRAQTLGSTPDTLAAARPFYERACQLGSASACEKLETPSPP